jgi:hypothetical protein
VASGKCWFVLRKEYYWLVAGKYCWLVVDKRNESTAGWSCSQKVHHSQAHPCLSFFFAILKTMNIWVFPPRFEPFMRGTKRRPLTLLHKLITAAWAASTSPCPALHRSRCLHSLCTQSHRLCCDRSNSCLRCRSAFYAGVFRLPHTWYMIETAAMPAHLSSPRVHTHVCTVTYTRVCNVSRGVNSSESTTYNTSSMCSCCRNGINPLLIYLVDRFKASSLCSCSLQDPRVRSMTTVGQYALGGQMQMHYSIGTWKLLFCRSIW